MVQRSIKGLERRIHYAERTIPDLGAHHLTPTAIAEACQVLLGEVATARSDERHDSTERRLRAQDLAKEEPLPGTPAEEPGQPARPLARVGAGVSEEQVILEGSPHEGGHLVASLFTERL